MLKPATILAAVLILVALVVWGLRSDLAACTAAPDSSSELAEDQGIQPLADFATEVDEPAAALSVGGGAAEDIAPFGIVAPVFPGFGLDSYATKCDPFDDPYGSCL
ncbi:MAG: hypothetical protein OES47_01195 [Acidobacteriota bacterium]|nr:hypothetical protein [Acidobacteriota bacterium]